jgi:hypothetical protein
VRIFSAWAISPKETMIPVMMTARIAALGVFILNALNLNFLSLVGKG